MINQIWIYGFMDLWIYGFLDLWTMGLSPIGIGVSGSFLRICRGRYVGVGVLQVFAILVFIAYINSI